MKVTKNDGKLFTPFDFRIGCEVEILGRKVFLCECDLYTREFYENNEKPQPLPMNYPADNFEQKSFLKPSPVREHEITDYLERTLGGGKIASQKQFLENNNKVSVISLISY